MRIMHMCSHVLYTAGTVNCGPAVVDIVVGQVGEAALPNAGSEQKDSQDLILSKVTFA